MYRSAHDLLKCLASPIPKIRLGGRGKIFNNTCHVTLITHIRGSMSSQS